MVYVTFLRGINVSGKNKVNMKDLMSLLLEHGIEAKYYLNTGNIIYQSDKSHEKLIKQLLVEHMSVDVKALTKDIHELRRILSSFTLTDELKNAYVTLFSTNISIEDHIIEKKQAEDLVSFYENYICLYVPGGYGKTKLTNNYMEKKSGAFATTRNRKTMTKVLDLMEELC